MGVFTQAHSIYFHYRYLLKNISIVDLVYRERGQGLFFCL